MPKPSLRRFVLDLLAGVAHQRVQGFFRQIAAGRAIGPGVGRTRRRALRQTPGNQPGHGIAAGMVRAEALREKDPYRHRRRVNPTLPKPSCGTEGFFDTILGKQRGEVQVAVPTSFRHRGAKRMNHLWPPCHWGIGLQQPLVTREAFFVHIIFAHNNLQKFKCHSVMSPFLPA